jgi:hypothetical protein
MAAALILAMHAVPPAFYQFRNPRHEPSDKGLHQMRAVAVADDAGSAASQVGLIAAAATALGAAISAIGLWLANKLIGKAAFETMMTTRFQVMMDQQRAFHAEERAAWKDAELRLNGEIVNLRQTVASLTSTLRRQGVIDIPEAKYGDDPLITIPPGGDAI